MRNDLKVGLFVFIALIVLLFILDFVGDVPFLTSEKKFVAHFDSIAELKEGNPVKMEGVPVGKVSEIKLKDGRIAVVMKVQKDAPVKQDSIATIRLTSLLGTSYINLSFGSETSPLAGNNYVLGTEPPADLNEILVKLQSAADSMDSALSVFSSFGENKEDINKIFTNLNVVLNDLAQGEGTLGKLLKDESLYNELTGTFANINDISRSIREGKGTFGKLVNDDTLYNDTKTAMKNLSKVSSSLADSKGTIGKLMNDDKLYNEATEAATNLNSILKKVNNGQGTLGKLVNEDDLYYDAKNTVLKVDKGVDTLEDLAPISTLGAIMGVMTVF